MKTIGVYIASIFSFFCINYLILSIIASESDYQFMEMKIIMYSVIGVVCACTFIICTKINKLLKSKENEE